MARAAILFVIAVAGIVGVLYWLQSQTGAAVVTGFVEADQIRVGSRVGGRVAEVMVEEGDRVQAGRPLFRIDEFDLAERLAEAQAQAAAGRAELKRLRAGFREEEIAQARAKRDHAQATLDKLIAGPRPAEINIAKEHVRIAQANLDLAQTEYDRLSRLREEDSAAKVELDVAIKTLKESRAQLAAANEQLQLLEEGTRKEELAEARAALAQAEAALKLVETGSRTEDIAKAEAQVSAAEATVNAIRSQMEELIVESPCDCTVEATDLRPGDLVAPNAPAVSLLDFSRMWVRTYVPHGMLHRVRLGARLPIRMDSFPDRTFTGEVMFIAGEAEFAPRNIQTPEERSKQVFRVKLRLDDGRELLHVGMAADVLLDEASETKPGAQAAGGARPTEDRTSSEAGRGE